MPPNIMKEVHYAFDALRRGCLCRGCHAPGEGGVASAHEHRQVGNYQFIVGFLNEPAIVDEPNSLDLRVYKGQSDQGTPVEGLDKTLKAEISNGRQTMPLQLKPAFGKPGSYTGYVIPTAEGDYTFHIFIFGSIEGQLVDEKFTSGPNTFTTMESHTALSFPVKVPPAAAIANAADSARLVGMAGLGVGVLGLIAGIAGIMMARGARASSDTGTARLTSHQPGD